MKKIKKVVFPVAGLGTRFLPATKASPKEMLPIVDKPLIQYAAEEAASAGIKELIFIIGRTKNAIIDHFDSAPELENELIDKKEFYEGLEISNKILSDRLFDIFDKDNNGKIDHDEFLATIEEIIFGSKDAKIRFAFKLHDLDGSGFIDKNELTVLISQSFVQNNLDYDDFQLKLLVDEFFQKADKDKNGSIDIDEFLVMGVETIYQATSYVFH